MEKLVNSGPEGVHSGLKGMCLVPEGVHSGPKGVNSGPRRAPASGPGGMECGIQGEGSPPSKSPLWPLFGPWRTVVLARSGARQFNFGSQRRVVLTCLFIFFIIL